MTARTGYHRVSSTAVLRIAVVMVAAITLVAVGCQMQDSPVRDTDKPLLSAPLRCRESQPFPGYEELMANPSRYGGQCIRISGIVFQAYTTEFERSVAFIDTVPRAPSGPVFVYGTEECFKDGERVVEGSEISLKVRMANKLYGYQSAGNSWNEVPIGICGEITISAPIERTDAKEKCRSVSDQAVREYSDWQDIRFVSETAIETGYMHQYQAYHGELPISTHIVHMDNQCNYPSTHSKYP